MVGIEPYFRNMRMNRSNIITIRCTSYFVGWNQHRDSLAYRRKILGSPSASQQQIAQIGLKSARLTDVCLTR